MSITRNSVLAFAPQATGIVVGIGTSIVTARVLGASGRGVLALALLSLHVLLLVSDLGVGGSLTYFTSKGRLAPAQALATATIAAAVLGVIGVALAVVVWPLLEENALRGVSLTEYVLALAACPPMLFATFWTRTKMAQDEFVPAMRYQVTASIGTLFVILAVLVVFGAGIPTLLAALTIMYYALATALVALDARQVGFSPKLEKGLLGEIVSYGVRTYVGGLFNYAVLRIDAFILNSLTDTTRVGQYTIAVTLTEKLWLVDSSVGQATMPEVVAREQKDAATMLATVNRNVILVLVLAGTALALLAHPLISLLYGAEFLPAVAPIRVLLPGVVAYASGRTLLQYYMGQLGRPGVASAVMGGAAVMSVVLYLTLIPPYGMVGAALASTLTYTLIFAVALTLFIRATGLGLRETLVADRTDIARYGRWIAQALGRTPSEPNGSDQ